MTWKIHIDQIASKIARSIGILNRLKYILPTSIKTLIYNSLILSHINYGILIWGYQNSRILKLQKKALRIITLAKYNSHTEPIFKSLRLLKVNDIFFLRHFQFFHDLLHEKVPKYFLNIPFSTNQNIHNYYTRRQRNIHVYRVKHSFAKKCIRYSIPEIINSAPSCITDKLITHSVHGLKFYIKNKVISEYTDTCQIQICYICNNNN